MINKMTPLGEEFFHRNCDKVAEELVGKLIVRKTEDGELVLRITETESYGGEEDTACHASKGRTARTELLYREAGTIYVYLCYGIHWLFNIITGEKEQPQGVLIRACEKYDGPAKLTKYLKIDKDLNGSSVIGNPAIYIADDGFHPDIERRKRVGIDYADEKDINALRRYADKRTKDILDKKKQRTATEK